MLQAFVQKNVRRILSARGMEHVPERNEDAITSMAFGPLAFMSPAECCRSLGLAFSPAFATFCRGRTAVASSVVLWPAGLQCVSEDGGRPRRCEPDLVVRLDFDRGAALVVIVETKWDWKVTSEELSRQAYRERDAVGRRAAFSGSDQMMVTVTKKPVGAETGGVDLQSTWTGIEGRLNRYAASAGPGPTREWARLVSSFLRMADQSAFQGLGADFDFKPAWRRTPVFYGGDQS